MAEKPNWIEDIEIEDAQVKWAFSAFDGRDSFAGDGNYNFTVHIPDADVERLRQEGWNVKTRDGYEEGDPEEHTLKIKVSDKYGLPPIFLIKGDRKFRVNEIRDLQDIRRDTLEQLDVIVSPSRWVRGDETGVTAYVKEMFAKVKQSRFSDRYADYEEA